MRFTEDQVAAAALALAKSKGHWPKCRTRKDMLEWAPTNYGRAGYWMKEARAALSATAKLVGTAKAVSGVSHV